MDQKHSSEMENIAKRQKNEKSALEESFDREDKDNERYIASLKEIRKDLAKDREKMSNNSSNDDGAKLEAAKGTLECPVCMDIMKLPTRIWMCRNSHAICEDCKVQLIRDKGGPYPPCLLVGSSICQERVFYFFTLIPNGPLFNDVIPTEIKEHILSLSFPRDADVFVAAAVCQDWKMILESRFGEQKMIFLSETDEYVEAAELMGAAAAHKLDVHLVIDKPVTEVDSKLVTEALTSVSKLTVKNNLVYNYDVEILSDEQFDHLFASMEKGEKIMDEVKLINLDLTGINQERLANCFVTKIKRLTLDAAESDNVMHAG